MPLCSDCLQWYSVKSRIPKVCRECESKQIARAARLVDESSMSIATLASWIMTGRKPRRWKEAYEIK